jgi:hypothetical protein
VADAPADVGDLRFAWTSAQQSTSNGEPAWGWTYLPSACPAGGDVWISTLNPGVSDTNWSAGHYNYEALLHEIGHALGLKHDFEGSVTLPASLDNDGYTVMSYARAPHSVFYAAQSAVDPTGYRTNQVSPETPMVLDIAAIQYLYGANMASHTGDDIYSFDPVTPFFKTIWDAGGNDTISISNFSNGSTIDLRAGHYSTIATTCAWPVGTAKPADFYDGTSNLGIAFGVTIENAIGGSGNDTIRGNAADNHLDGGAGVDTALYSGPRASYTIARANDGWTVQANQTAEGTDTLLSVERLHFNDLSVALDIDGNAGIVARTMAAVFGSQALSNPALAGIGLNLLDQGMSADQLMQLALDQSPIGPCASDAALVDLLYSNITGQAPCTTVEATFVDMLQSHALTRVGLALLAADSAGNAAAIDLTGLALTGLDYLPLA